MLAPAAHRPGEGRQGPSRGEKMRLSHCSGGGGDGWGDAREGER